MLGFSCAHRHPTRPLDVSGYRVFRGPVHSRCETDPHDRVGGLRRYGLVFAAVDALAAADQEGQFFSGAWLR